MTAEEDAVAAEKTGTPLKVKIPWWLVPLMIALLLLILAGVGYYLWKKRQQKRNNEEGAPLVDYNIEDDDAEAPSEGDADGQESEKEI